MSPHTQELREAPGSPRRLRGRRFHAPVIGAEPATPLLRTSRAAALTPCEWGAALSAHCRGFRRLRAAHGAQAATWTVNPNMTNEELAFCAALACDGLGFISVAAGGAPVLSPAWEAPEESEVVIAFGPQVTAAHSPLWPRLSSNRHQPRVIAIASGVAACADAEAKRYAPTPGSGRALLHGLANIIIASGWLDHRFIHARTTGFDDYARLVAHYTTDRVSAETGLAAELIWDLAQTIGTAARVCFCGKPDPWPQAASALRNLALLTGQWARSGTGLCVDLEPANALGTQLLARTGALAQCEAAAQAGLKGLWVIASDAVWSDEELERWRLLAARLEFLVVQGGDAATLAPMADLFLPTSGWRAREGTRLDSSGRLRLLKPRAQPPGCAMTDFRLFQLIAQYGGCGAAFSRWSSPETAFQILKTSTRGGPHDFSGVADYSEIDAYRPAAEAVSPGAALLPFLFD